MLGGVLILGKTRSMDFLAANDGRPAVDLDEPMMGSGRNDVTS